MPHLWHEGSILMACPSCGCRVHYQFNSEEDFAGDDERLERCAGCGAVFDIEDAADDEDDAYGTPASAAPISFEAVDGRILSGSPVRPHNPATCPWCKDASGVKEAPNAD